MRSRSRKIQKLVYSLLFAAAGPHGGEDDGRPTSRADAEEYVLLYHYDTKRIWSGNMKRLLSVRVRFVSPPGAVKVTHTLRHSDRMERITDADHTYENDGIVKMVASVAVMISAGKNTQANELHIMEGSVVTDAFVSRMYKRTSCEMHVEETVWLKSYLFGAILIHMDYSFDDCDDLTRSTMMSRWRDMTMTQYRYYFTLVTPLDEHLTHRMGEDAVQSAPPQPSRQRAEALEPMSTVTELVADVPVFLCELIVLQ